MFLVGRSVVELVSSVVMVDDMGCTIAVVVLRAIVLVTG